MHRLFWKLFLSFWAALVLFGLAVLVAASLFLEQTRTRQERPYERMVQHLAAAQAAADAQGLEGLRRWAREVDRDELVPVLLVDGEGRDLLDREVPPRLQRYLARRGPHHGPTRGEPGAVVRLADGSGFRLVPDFQSVSLGRVLSRPKVLAVPLLLAALAGGLVCLLLARYLAAPIERLRHATLVYAQGDFSARVGPTLGGRRDEIAELARALDHMAEQVGSLIQSKQGLLRDVSHELRSPLARLQAALGLARQRAGGEVGPELDRIERETERLDELIGQILSLSRLESGLQAPRREPVELNQLLREVVEAAALEAQGRGCKLSLGEAANARLEGDPGLLHSALENVVRNALRYAPAGSEVAVSLAAQGSDFLIRVADRGPGVPPDMLERIFEPFVRVGEARDAQSGGFGLGLAIARRAVRQHGGDVRAQNRVGGGLEVTIRLPAV